MKIAYTIIYAFIFLSINCSAQSPSYQWAKSIGITTDNSYGFAITTDATGNSLVIGQFGGTVDFDPGAGVANLSANGGTQPDAFVAKYTSAGNYVWAFQIGSATLDDGYSITTDAAGNVHVTGDFTGTADFDPGAGIANLTSTGSYDAFVAKYNSAGAYQWAFKLGSSNPDFGYGITLDNLGNVIVTGGLGGLADFDPLIFKLIFKSIYWKKKTFLPAL